MELVQILIRLFLALSFSGVSASAQLSFTHGEPSAFEQYMLELVNAARANPPGEAARLGIDLNEGLPPDTISKEAKPPLTFHPQLISAARGHSDWMLANSTFTHVGVDGTTPTQRAQRAAFPFSASENIAYRSSNGMPDYSAMTRGIHESLFLSAGHRRNLMRTFNSVVGIGLRAGKFQGTNAFMATQNFSEGGATPDSGPFIVGVAYADHNSNGICEPGEGVGSVLVESSLGSHRAVTSTSGGFAIPMIPVSTNTDIVNLPVSGADWSAVEPYDSQYRAQKVAAALSTNVQLRWSGGLLPGVVTSDVSVKIPIRINYRLQGTDGLFYERTMVTAQSVKSDLVISAPAAVSSVKLLPAKRSVQAGKSTKIMLVVGNNSTNAIAVPVYLGSSDPEKLPAHGYVTVEIPGKKSEKQRPSMARKLVTVFTATNAVGVVQLSASAGGGINGSVSQLTARPSKKR